MLEEFDNAIRYTEEKNGIKNQKVVKYIIKS